MRYGNYLLIVLVMIGLLSVSFSDAGKNIQSALGCMFKTVRDALAVGMMLLVVAAAVVYAVGQVLGAETRARASVWATAMFIGAIIGALIYILLPMILGALFPTGSPDGINPDMFTDPSKAAALCGQT